MITMIIPNKAYITLLLLLIAETGLMGVGDTVISGVTDASVGEPEMVTGGVILVEPDVGVNIGVEVTDGMDVD
jgi:hypothetical protein